MSKGIVAFARETGNPTIAVEALEGIRERGKRMQKAQRRQINSWAFGQLQDFIIYKAETHGFDVLEIDPRNTSKGCSQCGFLDAANRHGHAFSCKACGYRLHADLNGARNISACAEFSPGKTWVRTGCRQSAPKARTASPSRASSPL